MRDLLLRRVDSPVVVCGLYSCGTWALRLRCTGLICPMAYGILVPPPGIGPTSLALEGKFLTSGPPGKSQGQAFIGIPAICRHCLECVYMGSFI